MHAKVFSIQIFPIFASNSAEGLHFSAFHFVGSSFTSNVTGRCYNVTCAGKNMNCGTKNIIHLISCRKCAVQYVGETSQTLRNRFNNHRNRLKQLCGLYLYHHFNSDSLTLEGSTNALCQLKR